jgi:hypothetical protein
VSLRRLPLREALRLAEETVDEALRCPPPPAASPLVPLAPFLAACCSDARPPPSPAHLGVRVAAARAAAVLLTRLLEAGGTGSGRGLGGRGVLHAAVRAAVLGMGRLASLLAVASDSTGALAAAAARLCAAADALLAAAAALLSVGKTAARARLQWIRLSESARAARAVLGAECEASEGGQGSASKKRRGRGRAGEEDSDWARDVVGDAMCSLDDMQAWSAEGGDGDGVVGDGADGAGDEQGAGGDSDGFESADDDPDVGYYAVRRRRRRRRRLLETDEGVAASDGEEEDGEEEDGEEDTVVIDYRP